MLREAGVFFTLLRNSSIFSSKPARDLIREEKDLLLCRKIMPGNF
jgi:hypothetical protein